MQKIVKSIIVPFLVFVMVIQGCEKSSESAATAASSGANGSMTRFITYNNFLYIVDHTSLKAYDISNPTPVLKKITSVGFNIETIFEYQGKLFIGSNNAIFIYGLLNPEQPSLISQFSYFIPGKDPVVAIDSVAYSTTRNLNGQGGNLNVVNIKKLKCPGKYGRPYDELSLWACN
jgi:hypothetical protein